NYRCDTTEQVMAVYPGMYKKVNLGFQVSIDGGGLKSDVSFELMTADKGNTGKSATYKMIVSVGKQVLFGYAPLATTMAMDTAKSSNVAAYRTSLGSNDFWVVDNIYTTTLDTTFTKQKINIAEKIGVSPEYFNGKKIYVTLYSSGTGTNIEPGVFDPVVAIDNVEGVYGAAYWSVPDSVGANAVINHNNGTPAKTVSTDFSGGTPVVVPADSTVAIKFYLRDANRAAVIDITEANDGGSHNAKYSFAATGAVKAKAADGTYSVDVPYTYTPSDGTTKFDLKVAAPASGMISDTLEVSINVKVALNAVSSERLEITNGMRFWYNISAKGTAPAGVAPLNTNAVRIWGRTNTIVTANATENVSITNLAGQVLKSVSASQANRGIAMQTGVYIVKTGDKIQKVIVK
ncbi:MAG: T9SS type A sorting domain-containing protein, partial [Paludibacter sp.]